MFLEGKEIPLPLPWSPEGMGWCFFHSWRGCVVEVERRDAHSPSFSEIFIPHLHLYHGERGLGFEGESEPKMCLPRSTDL